MLRKMLRILLPSPCLSCGLFGDALCFDCLLKLGFEPHVRQIEDMKVYSASYYLADSLSSRLVHLYKYQHQSDLHRIFFPFLRDALRLLCLDFERVLVCPVPLAKERERERGYNQAQLFCRSLSRELGVEWRGLLIRSRETKSQALTESKAVRKQNMDGAFICLHPPPKNSLPEAIFSCRWSATPLS